MASSLPPTPANFKQLQHYIKIANEHEKRDQVVSYYCLLYTLQKGMEIDKKSQDCRLYLMHLMDLLEKIKQQNAETEAVQSEVVGQAHMEHYALKLFVYADNEDRAGHFGKNVVRSFYVSGLLFDVLTNFGELSEDLVKNRKYAKWKAAYIHRCLQSGETPIAGPLPEEGEEEEGMEASGGAPAIAPVQPPPQQPAYPPQGYGGYPQPPGQPAGQPPAMPSSSSQGYLSTPGAGAHAPPTTPSDSPPVQPQQPPPAQPATRWQPPPNPGVSLTPDKIQALLKHCKFAGSALQYQDVNTSLDNITRAINMLTGANHARPSQGGVALKADDYQKAMKYCKYAGSALQYEDSKTAIDNLVKALNLLTTGHE